MKLCHKCSTIKKYSEFNKDPSARDGYYTMCKECKAQYRKIRTIAQGRRVKDIRIIEGGLLLCNKCHNKKPLVEFPKNSKTKLGYYSHCKKCTNETSRSLREETGIPIRYTRKIMDGKLRCGKCQDMKPLSLFTKSKIRKNEYSSHCKLCQKEWRDKNKEKLKHIGIKRTYGISGEEYNKMKSDQDGRCIICNVLPSGFKKDVLHIDHDHITKKVRGLLCGACNTAIGLFKEDTIAMVKAIEYINAHKELT